MLILSKQQSEILCYVFCYSYWTENEASEVGDDLDEDVAEALNENESEIRSYLLHGDPLSEELLEEYIQSYWNSEPYKYVIVISTIYII